MVNTYVAQMHLAAQMQIKKLQKVEEIKEEIEEIKWTNLKEVVGIWENTKARLIENWVSTVEKLKELSKEEIEAIIKNPISRTQIYTYLNI